QQETVDALVTAIKFEKEPDDYYGEKYHTYSANVENTTGINFEQLNIKVKLYDSEGTVVGTENVYIEKFMAESTEKLEFSTDAEFEKMEVSCDSWKEAK
ncbi:MAG: FxLYD domain-containing protein, partial [Mogibacterium sp.]|nr:FxLYD domain-containing protein [Mogibacterium sp.]